MKETIHKKWYEEEFASLQLGDKRLNQRFLKICEDFNKTPQAIISQAIEGSHQCKAAYRFWQNNQVTSKAFLEAHGNSIKVRLENNEEYILELQDSSELNFSSHIKTSKLGPIGEGKYLKGLEMHSSIITSESGLVLGIGSCYLWARESKNKNKGKNYRKVNWEDKESIKWARALEEVDRIGIKGRVTVTDREGDIFALLEKAKNEERQMIVRLRWNRKIEQSNHLAVKEFVQTQACAGTYEIKIFSKGGIYPREERSTKVEVRFAKIDFLYSKVSKTKPKKLNVTVIHAKEINPAEGEVAIEWFLITNLFCNDLTNAIRIIRCYEKRWLVEEFHKILKGAIKIEEARLSTGEKLDKLIVFLAIFACRMLWVSRLGRLEPNLPCVLAFEEEEWKFIMLRVYKKELKNLTIPSIKEIITGIAKLGGYWGRKSDPPPGIINLWRGWIKLYDALDTLRELNLSVN